jgi:cytoskeletal protein CcmA (bactofilin family)
MLGKRKAEAAGDATRIGPGTEIRGDVSFRGELLVAGRIVGDVTGHGGMLTIAPDGIVEGSVDVESLALAGTVTGDVTVRRDASLGAGSRIEGNLQYRMLEMEAGARVNGRLVHEQEPQATGPSAARKAEVDDPSGLG